MAYIHNIAFLIEVGLSNSVIIFTKLSFIVYNKLAILGVG